MLLIVVVGFVLLTYTQSFIAETADLARSSPEAAAARAARAVTIVTTALGVTAIAGAVYLGRLGARTWWHREFPPPGTWVIRDTRVLSGGTARSVGLALMVAGTILLAVGLALPLMGANLAKDLENRAAATDVLR